MRKKNYIIISIFLCFGFQYANAYEGPPTTCNLFDSWRPEEKVSHILKNPLVAAHSMFQTIQLSLMGMNSPKVMDELKAHYPHGFVKDLEKFEKELELLYRDEKLSHPYFLLIRQTVLDKFEELRKFFLHTSFDQLQDFELVTRKLAELKNDLVQYDAWSREIKSQLQGDSFDVHREEVPQQISVPVH